MQLAGIDLVTTLPAPIVVPSPMVTPGKIILPPPIQTFFPMFTGLVRDFQKLLFFAQTFLRCGVMEDCIDMYTRTYSRIIVR